MSVIVGERLKNLVSIISDCPEKNIEYAGVNVSIDDWFSSEILPDGGVIWEAYSSNFSINPKRFLRARLQETFVMPNNVMGMFTIRSKYAQQGLEHSTSILLKPTWAGKLILELTNLSSSSYIKLNKGDLIGQITFFECHDY
jgi:deoxycytidine triphosphate deaminase